MHVDLFFNHYFNILSVKTEINNDSNNNNNKKQAKKDRLNLTNLEVWESLERKNMAND